jgi:hypothetical protein
LAQAHVHSRDVEQACQELAVAAALAQRTWSARSVATIRTARAELSDHDHEPLVRDLDESVAVLRHVAA